MRNDEIRLSDLNQWLPYKFVRRASGKLGKPPVDHRTGEICNGDDPAAWLSREAAKAYAKEHGLPGIGFMPTKYDPFGFIDLDDCIIRGQLVALAVEIMTKHSTYAELSPSKTGLHVLVKTDLHILMNRKRLGIEIYSYGQFVTFTGNRWPTSPNKIEWADIQWLVDRYQAQPEQAPKSPKPPPVAISSTPDDQQLWRLIWRVDKTKRAERLYHGDLSVVGNDHSGGVIVLLNTLARFTNGDQQRMARMLAQTALPPEKWERPLNGGTWLDHQIENACRYVGV